MTKKLSNKGEPVHSYLNFIFVKLL